MTWYTQHCPSTHTASTAPSMTASPRRDRKRVLAKADETTAGAYPEMLFRARACARRGVGIDVEECLGGGVGAPLIGRSVTRLPRPAHPHSMYWMPASSAALLLLHDTEGAGGDGCGEGDGGDGGGEHTSGEIRTATEEGDTEEGARERKGKAFLTQ